MKIVLNIFKLSDKIIYLLLFILILLNFSPLKTQRIAAQGDYPPEWLNYFKIAEWIKQNTPPDTIVCSRKNELFYFFSDRLSVGYLFTRDEEKIINNLRDEKVDYIVVEQLGYKSTELLLVPALNKNSKFFSIVYRLQNPDTALIKFYRDR